MNLLVEVNREISRSVLCGVTADGPATSPAAGSDRRIDDVTSVYRNLDDALAPLPTPESETVRAWVASNVAVPERVPDRGDVLNHRRIQWHLD
jgi:hypothetical protein